MVVRICVICDLATFVHTASFSTKVRCFRRHFDIRMHHSLPFPLLKQQNKPAKSWTGLNELSTTISQSAVLLHVDHLSLSIDELPSCCCLHRYQTFFGVCFLQHSHHENAEALRDIDRHHFMCKNISERNNAMTSAWNKVQDNSHSFFVQNIIYTDTCWSSHVKPPSARSGTRQGMLRLDCAPRKPEKNARDQHQISHQWSALGKKQQDRVHEPECINASYVRCAISTTDRTKHDVKRYFRHMSTDLTDPKSAMTKGAKPPRCFSLRAMTFHGN